jgi:hypothetical protein
MIAMFRMSVSISESALIARISSISSNIIGQIGPVILPNVQISPVILPNVQIVPISFHNNLNNLLSLSRPIGSSIILSKPLSLSRPIDSSIILTKPSGLEKEFISKLLSPSNSVHKQVSNQLVEPVPEPVPNQLVEPVPETVPNQLVEPVLKSNFKTTPNLVSKNIRYDEQVVVHDFEIDDENVIKKVDYSKQNSIPLGEYHSRLPRNFPLYKFRTVKTDDVRDYINDMWKKNGYM